MPKFKTIKYTINKSEHTATININSKGIFSINVPAYIADAVGLDGNSIEGTDAEKLDHAFHKIIRKYLKIAEEKVYEIKYRISLSKRVKNNIPEKIFGEKGWRNTTSYGAEYIAPESITIVLDWHPVLTVSKGKHLKETILQVPEADDYYLQKAEEEVKNGDEDGYYQSYFHKPYEGLVLVSNGAFWDNEKKYLSIPLTKETFEFFTGVEGSLQTIITKLFAFLNRDSEDLLADISKVIANNNFKQIGL